MRLQKHFILTLALAATVLGVTASRAGAAEVYKGTFTMPVDAYWSGSLLHAGEYSIWMNSDYMMTSVVHLRGENFQAAILTGAVTLRDASVGSRLVLEQINGTYVVRELKAGALGKDFRFGVSKVVQRQTEHASAGSPIKLAVAVGGGF
jgi:hypothetical protein